MDEALHSDERIGEGLIRTGVMTREQVDSVLRIQRSGNDSLFGVIAMELGYADEGAILAYFEARENNQ